METRVLGMLHAGDYAYVRRSDFKVLRHLDAEGTRMSDLALRANLTKASMTSLVRACADFGLLTVEHGKDDRRSRLVHFTAKGDELMGFFREALLTVERELRDHLGGIAYEDLRASLLKLSGMAEVIPFSPARRLVGRG